MNGEGDRVVCPWERRGWKLLYAVPVAGGRPAELVIGRREDVVHDVELAWMDALLPVEPERARLRRDLCWKRWKTAACSRW